MKSSVREVLAVAAGRVARRDAELLLREAMGRERAWVMAHPEAAMEAAQAERFWEMVSRREAGEPVQYLLGRQEFFGMQLEVGPAVLIPRPETELLVEAVVRWARERGGGGLRVVDVGTGSGAIALGVARELVEAEVWAVDVSPAVREVVERNRERLGLGDRVRFAESDLLELFLGSEELEMGLDVVVSNPPYVPLPDAPGLAVEVREFEPHLALFGGEDGLAVYRRLIPQAWRALREGGLLAMEIGFGQREALAELLAGWAEVAFTEDYAGIPRVVTAERR